MNNLTTQPPKGTADWMPAEFAVRKYIFDTWRSVCEKFGYQEYLTPLVEYADVYRAKSGEDVGGKELTIFTDRAGRELAIRPEMTPSVTRMVAEQYQSLPKPIRLFSIANFFRNEKPQRGRNREFWQLNFDIFGSDSVAADAEILQMAVEIMLSFGAQKSDFKVFVNHRQTIENFVKDYLKVPTDNMLAAIRLLDKVAKLPKDEFFDKLNKLGAEITDPDTIYGYLTWDHVAISKVQESFLKDDPGYLELTKIIKSLEASGLDKYIEFNPGMVRGFDYYDGMVFEVFDYDEFVDSVESNGSARSLFGGGRYNGLAGIFGKESFPAVGCAPGDETTKLFLQAKGLIPESLQARQGYYLPIIDEKIDAKIMDELAANFRKQGKKVIRGLELEAFGKALSSADKMNAAFTVIIGERELQDGVYTLKNMETGEQSRESLEIIKS